jgi:hypothetical protein
MYYNIIMSIEILNNIEIANLDSLYREHTDCEIIEQIIKYNDLIQNEYYQTRIINILQLYLNAVFIK